MRGLAAVRARAVVHALVVAMAAWSSAGEALAHGLAPAITAVAATSGQSPTVLVVSEGLAQHRAGKLHFVCPVQFGSEQSPPALSADGARTFVVGMDDLFSLSSDGTVKAEGRPELSRRQVLGLSAVKGALYAFRFQEGQAQIVPLDPPGAAPIWTDPGPYDSLSPADDGFWVSRVEGTTARAVRIDPSGHSTEERSFPVDEGSIIGRVVESAGTLYAGVISAYLAGRVVRVGKDGASSVLALASAAVQGPVVLETGQVFATAEAELIELSTGVPSRVAGTEATCLGRLGDLSYTCSRTKLWSLAATGPATLLADLADLEAPDPSLVDPTKRAECESQWQVFQGDLRAVGVLAPTDSGTGDAGDSGEPPRGSASDGCAVTPRQGRGASWAGAGAALAVLGWLRGSWRKRRARLAEGFKSLLVH